ncbi:MAG: TIGR00282 family metallophosphoesterase [Candidatus Saganbacteria bacterium]|nr:TIGR00282 family metallophosphoesterase [Candidatus Saganbacteria bacterium]
MDILFIGDIIGRYGREITKKLIPELKEKFKPDIIITNGENSASGYGITVKVYNELMDAGIDAITMGNHMWDKKEIMKDIDNLPYIVRPANYPKGTPGKEYLILEKKGVKVGILNLVGRVFMQPLECPFRTSEELLKKISKETPIILVDIHAEATSEKAALGWFLDGQVSAVIGTHTHVLTADERLLPKGTAFISDIGMVGARNSIIGMDIQNIVDRFLTGMPRRFEPVKSGPGIFNAVLIRIDENTGKPSEIKRINKVTEEISSKESEAD